MAADIVNGTETGKVGFVFKAEVYPWLTREVLNLSPIAVTGKRLEIVAWDNQTILQNFLETGNGPPTYRENLASTINREQAARPYPVLSSEVKSVNGAAEKRVFNVLFPTVFPPDESIMSKFEEADNRTTFVIAFPANAGMDKFAQQIARELNAAFLSLPPDLVSRCEIGFVFYRDEFEEEKYVVVKPQPAADALKRLADAATPTYMKGGRAYWPVLDAVYIAHHLFPWPQSYQERKIIIAILWGDATPVTTGKLHSGVPSEIKPKKIAGDLLFDGIPVIAVQAGPGVGEYLISVLTQLSDGTRGSFIGWGTGDPDERGKEMSAAISGQLSTKKNPAPLAFGPFYSQLDAIPLDVLNSNWARRLRDSILNRGGGGAVLIREGFVLENKDLVGPQISIDKKTLDSLAALFSALSLANVDASKVKEKVGLALSAIAGENYDPKEDIETTIKRRLGIQFRSNLLSFNLRRLAAMRRQELLAMTSRSQDAGKKLRQFEEANLEALNKGQSVWMPVSQLP
ncbi:MAG: VWA domain-containing protein [Rhodomicrobium sp.]